MSTKIGIEAETPEEAAESISKCLDFLRREAEALGMSDVSDLVGRAYEKARERNPS